MAHQGRAHGIITTKKERVVGIARDDPFLSIEEIAQLAGTTPRYVRTTLSEGDVSLMELRRIRARDMERRLGRIPRGRPQGDRQEASSDLVISAIQDEDVARLLNIPSTELLTRAMRVRRVDGVLAGIEELFSRRGFAVAVLGKEPGPGELLEDLSWREPPAGDRSLCQVFGLEVPGRTVRKNTAISVVPAEDYFVSKLGVGIGHPVINVASVVVVDGAEVALERLSFDALLVELRLSVGSEVQVCLKTCLP